MPEEPSIAEVIHRYGTHLRREAKLQELNAPMAVVEYEKKLVVRWCGVLRERVPEAIEWLRKKVVSCQKMSDETIIIEMASLAMRVAEHYEKEYEAHNLLEWLDNADPDDMYDTGTTIKITWEYIGEGMDGDYNPDDPNDVKLLRFYICKEDIDGWIEVDDGSFCTRMPIDTPRHLLAHGLKCIWEAVQDALNADESIRKICEEISWCEPKWFEKGNRWEYDE